MRRAAALLLCALVGCAAPRPPRDPRSNDACSAAMRLPGADDVCDGMFTSDGLACVRCAEAGCVDQVDHVYCLNGSSCTADPNCTHSETLASRND